MATMVTNLAVANKFIGYIPLSIFHQNLKDVEINLQEFRIPPVEIGKVDLNYKGNTISIPGNTFVPGMKELNITYLVDSTWTNYYSLYSWAAGLAAQATSVDLSMSDKNFPDKEWSPLDKLLPVKIFLIDEFKNPILKFEYHNCWISSFGEINLSYTNEPNTISHSFVLQYTDFIVERVSSLG